MLKKRSLIILSLICFSFSSCLFNPKYLEFEANLLKAKQQLEEEYIKLKDLKLRLERNETKLKELELRLIKSEEREKECFKEISDINDQKKDLEKINKSLSHKIEEINLEMKKRNSIIQIQGRVIGLLDDTKKTIETSMKEQIAKRLVEIEAVEGKLKVTFTDKILFNSGSTKINKTGKRLLLKLADSLRENKNQSIVVEGHTDNVPVRARASKKFSTNWELSVIRATAIVRFLQQKGGLKPERLSACGYSGYRPVASNDTEKGRRQNRRIEIILGPSM